MDPTVIGDAKTSIRHLSLVMLSLILGQPARGFVVNSESLGQTRHWPLEISDTGVHTNVIDPATKAIRFFLTTDGFSSTNTSAELNAVRACFDQWQSVAGTRVKFEEGGLISPGADVNTSDHTNVVFWAKKSTLVNGGLDDISGALSITFPRVTADNVLLEADIVLNGVQFRWFTDFGSTNQTDQFIEATLLHEIGHFIGLDHSPVGGATMLARGAAGVNTQAGLSADDIAAVRFLYPAEGYEKKFGMIRGQVSMNGTGVFGACVIIEDSAGGIASGTVANQNGEYELPALTPGNYQIRSTPLDSTRGSSLTRLVSGPDIAPRFSGAVTDFLPTLGQPLAVTAGATNTFDFKVYGAAPPFRITRIQPATHESDAFTAVNAPATLRLGESNVVVGVYSPEFPAKGATLRVTGDGLTFGSSRLDADAFPGSNPALNRISISVNVASNAAPGLRSFIVQQGTNTVYANGFLEILPAVPDFNFDGLDDTFQRRYFSPFTSAAAAPNADPDGDGFSNANESAAGTDPTNSLDVLKIERVTRTPSGCTLVWQSIPGKRYQLFATTELDSGSWKAVGTSIEATGRTAQFLDLSATNSIRFYQVSALP